MPATVEPTRPAHASAEAERSGSFLARNLGALFAADIGLARALDAVGEADLPAVVPTRSGHFSATHQGVALASRHNPPDEAKRLVDGVELTNKVAFALHGVGLGYHVTELLGRVPAEAMALLFEPDLAVLRRALECVDLAKALRTRRLTIITEPDKSALFAAVGARTVLMSMGLASLHHPPSLRLPGGSAFHDACASMVGDFVSYARTSLNTLVINGRKTAENITGNVLAYATEGEHGGLKELEGRYAGCPAIVISAGPSLRRNIHLLKGAKGKAVLIAVQTMLKPLLAMGIEPDFVTSLDYHEISGRFFEDLPPKLSTHLVAEPKCTPAVLRMHPGPVSLARSEYADSLLRELRLERAHLPSGATVAHLAFYLARFLGCDPILFVGQDLGFSGNLCYSPGTRYDDVWRPELSRFCTLEMKQWDQIVRERPILRQIPATAGGMMYTEERLFTYLQQFERDFAESSQQIFDCTEGGALKRGATPMKLEEALGRFCVKPLPTIALAQSRSPQARQSATATQVRHALEARRRESNQIAEIARDTLPLLQEIADHLDDQTRVNRAIARIDLLRARMNDLGQTYDLITHLTQRSELDRFQADLKLSAISDPNEKQRDQIHRDIANCRGILQAAEDFGAMVGEAIETLPAAAAVPAGNISEKEAA